MANEDEMSHSRIIMLSRKWRHSHNVVVENEDENSHSHTIVSVNEKINHHLCTFLGLTQDFHSPLENQDLTIVRITLTRVPTMLRDQIKNQIINQVGVLKPLDHEGNLQNKRKGPKAKVPKTHASQNDQS